MVYREYETTKNDYSEAVEHRISITTTDFNLFRKIKAFAETAIEEEVAGVFYNDNSDRNS